MRRKTWLGRKLLGQKPWKAVGWFIYGIVGVTALITLVWLSLKWGGLSFFKKLGLVILGVGGINWLVKFLFGRDIFGAK